MESFACVLCDYTTPNKYDLTRHKKRKHEKKEMHMCDFEKCKYKSAYSANVRKHKLTHNPDKNFKCGLCAFSSHEKGNLKKHVKAIHSNDTKNKCEFCEFSTHDIGNLQKHINAVHTRTITYVCDQGTCNATFFRSDTLKNHKARIHNIASVVWKCSKCDYASLDRSTFRRHEEIHNERNSNMQTCPIKYCSYSSPYNFNMKQHLCVIHDIGPYQCELCTGKCAKLTQWKDPSTQKEYGVCRKCYHKVTGHKTKVEKQIVDWLHEHFKHPMVVQDKRVMGDACLKYRPDIMYSCGETKLVIFIEIDEHQHKYGNGSYECDEKRMSDLYDETPGSLVVFIRFNPHTYKLPQGLAMLFAEDRRKLLLSTINHIIENQKVLADTSMLHAIYICYDVDNPFIAKKIPTKVVYSIEHL